MLKFDANKGHLALRSDLKIHENYEALDEEIFDYFRTWYNITHEIKAKVVEIEGFKLLDMRNVVINKVSEGSKI